MYIILIIAAVVAVALLYVAFPYWIKSRTSYLQSYEKAVNGFHDSVQPLIKDEGTPNEVLDFILFMSQAIQDPKAARIAIAVFKADDDDFDKDKVDGHFISKFKKQRPELYKSLTMSSRHFLMAVSFNGTGIKGTASRMYLRRMVSRHQSVANAVAHDVYVYDHSHRSIYANSACAAAA